MALSFFRDTEDSEDHGPCLHRAYNQPSRATRLAQHRAEEEFSFFPLAPELLPSGDHVCYKNKTEEQTPGMSEKIHESLFFF